jgi:threonine dehydrogenase-like Zn-dependent dehydrogenase
MKGLVFLGERRIEFIDFEDPTPGPGEVVLEIKASGMCGSDLHRYRAPNAPRFIAGHEPSGIVAAIGPGVPPHVARLGDRVTAHHYLGCQTCEQCRTGWPQLCSPVYRRVCSTSMHGGHAPYMKARADMLIGLPEPLSFEAGSAISCGTGTAWGALERVGLRGTDTVAVFGQGPVGLSATLLASARGSRVIAVDIDDTRLELAKSFGADVAVNARDDVPAAIREATGGKGVEVSIETSGATEAATAALDSAAIWGRIALVGLGGTLSLQLQKYVDRQLSVLTSYSLSSVGQIELVDFVVKRGLDLDRLFTDRWTLDQGVEAYRHFDRQNSGKGVIVF